MHNHLEILIRCSSLYINTMVLCVNIPLKQSWFSTLNDFIAYHNINNEECYGNWKWDSKSVSWKKKSVNESKLIFLFCHKLLFWIILLVLSITENRWIIISFRSNIAFGSVLRWRITGYLLVILICRIICIIVVVVSLIILTVV